MNEKAIFAAGCFWGVQAAFDRVQGVVLTTVGYTGGHTKNPSYKDVCSGKTGHAEAIEIEFDPEKVSFEELLNVFFKIHNPTQKNRQGPDIGEQYRSAIFYTSQEQKEKAEKKIEELENSKKFGEKIVTEISPAKEFFKAEEYHQKYLEKNNNAVC